jgi:DegV family protein with EDD domain
MTRVAIVTDSSADLDPRAAAGAGLTVVPVSLALGADAIRSRSHGREEGTVWVGAELAEARPRPDVIEAFVATFATLGKTHDAIVAILLSGRLGDSVAAASVARERIAGIAPVTVIDSRSVSLGLGFQALRAAELATRGPADAAEIAAEVMAARDRYHVAFSVESVEHLRRSGQIGRSAAIIAEALQLKPLLRLDEGQIVPYERARTRTRAIAELADFVRELPSIARCAVLYATSRNDAIRLLRAVAQDTGLPPDRLIVQRIGEAVAAQVGPGALGVAVEEADAA